jgi:hypothetical protein
MARGVSKSAVKVQLVVLTNILTDLRKMAEEPVMVEGIVQIMRESYADYKAARDQGYSPDQIAEVFVKYGIEIDPAALEKQYTVEKHLRRKTGPEANGQAAEGEAASGAESDATKPAKAVKTKSGKADEKQGDDAAKADRAASNPGNSSGEFVKANPLDRASLNNV